MSTGIGVAPNIGIFDEVQWGTHLCHLYESDQDLIEVLVAYYRKGLERNALCLWLSSGPLGQHVMEALREGVPNFDRYRQKGQIQTISHAEWYLRDGRLSVPVAVGHASGALDQAKALGFEGLWVAGDLGWLDKSEWQTLVSYEETVCDFIAGAQVVALCAYPLRSLGIPEALDLFRIHQSIVMQREGRWKLIESLEQIKAEHALRDVERSYKHLFDTTLDGIEVIDAATGKILIVNQAAANIFGFASPEQMVGIDPLGYIPDEDKGRVAQMMAESMFEKDLHRVMELEALRTDGSEIWISAVGVRTQYQGRLAGLVSIRDITEQRKAEKALQESQRELQAVFDSVRDGIALFDLTGRLMAVNRRVLEVGGYTADELAGRSFDQLDMFGPQDIAKIESIFAPVLSGDEAPLLELEVVTKSGQTLMLDVRVTPLRRDNDVIGAIAVLRDTTERKLAERVLQESESKYRLLAENAQDVIIAMDMNLRPTYLSPSIERLTGYNVEEATVRSLEETLTAASLETAARAFADGLSQVEKSAGAARRLKMMIELELRCKDGSTVWAEFALSFMCDANGRPSGVLAVVRDVDERRRTQQALSDSEKRYRLLAENVSDVIWVTDVNLRPIYVSPSIERLLGYRADESLSRGLEEALDPSSASRVRDITARLMAAEGDESGELQHPVELGLRRRDGSTLWVDTTVTVIRDPGGHPVQFLGVLRDVTERKQAEEQLQQSCQKLEETLEGTIQAIRSIVDSRDRYTAGHQQRVTELACAIAEAMGLSSQQVRAVHMAGLLHDVGKILLPTEILTKPGRLNEIEFAMIKSHPRAGYDILKSIDFPWPIARMVLQHHERANGTGYPEGVRGEDILLEARILAVADVVEAMSSHRPYRAALGLDKALDEIVRNSGVLYDQQVVAACVRVFREGAFSFKGEASTDVD
jgi:PAS domain S-box-containing protein/putative nucleotidyltransferase with HDIG domain